MIFSWERYFQWTWVVVKDTQQPDVDTIASTSLEPIPTPCPHLSHHLSPSWSHCHHLLCCDNILAHFPWLLSPLTHPRTILLVTFKTYICLHLSAAQKPLEPPPPRCLQGKSNKAPHYYPAPANFPKASCPIHILPMCLGIFCLNTLPSFTWEVPLPQGCLWSLPVQFFAPSSVLSLHFFTRLSYNSYFIVPHHTGHS